MPSASYSFRPDPGGVSRLTTSPTGPVAQYLTRLGNRVVNNAKARANVDTGLMRSRIEFRLETQGGELVGIVAARTDYSVYVHAINPFLTDALADEIGR